MLLTSLLFHNFIKEKPSFLCVLRKNASFELLFRSVFFSGFVLCLHANQSVPREQTVNIDIDKQSTYK